MSDNPTTGPAQPPTRQPFLLGTRDQIADALNVCPNAQTFTALCPDLNGTLIIPLPCDRWSCRFCAEKKIRRLARLTRDAKPNRLCTLTVDPKKWTSPRNAFDGTRRQVSELIRKLRSQFGDIEYLRVTELTKNGWPHYHLLIRSKFLPQKKVAALWTDLTGAIIVDLRQVPDHWNAVTYLTKYLTKLHRIEWTERHVSSSKRFFPPQEKKEKTDLTLEQKQIVPLHPATYLHQIACGETLHPIGAHSFLLRPNNRS